MNIVVGIINITITIVYTRNYWVLNITIHRRVCIYRIIGVLLFYFDLVPVSRRNPHQLHTDWHRVGYRHEGPN